MVRLSLKEKKLEQVKKNIEDNLVCELKDAATMLVFGKGNHNAPILFIGEAPGAKEDKEGIPFVGQAGKRLDKSLMTINLSLKEIYIANILKYRPPKNRDPKKDEIKNHTPYLIEQIKIIKPKIIATLGNFSTKFVLAGFDTDGMKKIDGVSKLHGQKISIKIDKQKFIVCPLYHPAASMYRPSLKDTMIKDFFNMGVYLAKNFPDKFKMPKKPKEEKQMKLE